MPKASTLPNLDEWAGENFNCLFEADPIRKAVCVRDVPRLPHSLSDRVAADLECGHTVITCYTHIRKSWTRMHIPCVTCGELRRRLPLDRIPTDPDRKGGL